MFKQHKEELKTSVSSGLGYNRRIQAKHSRNVTFVNFVLNKTRIRRNYITKIFSCKKTISKLKHRLEFVPTLKTKVSTVYFQHHFVFFPFQQFFHRLFVSSIDL